MVTILTKFRYIIFKYEYKFQSVLIYEAPGRKTMRVTLKKGVFYTSVYSLQLIICLYETAFGNKRREP